MPQQITPEFVGEILDAEITDERGNVLWDGLRVWKFRAMVHGREAVTMLPVREDSASWDALDDQHRRQQIGIARRAFERMPTAS